MAWWDVTQPGAIICQPMQDLILQDMFDFCGNQMKKRTRGSHAAIFEVKFGQRSEESSINSRERTADTLSCDLESVALVIEGSDSKNNFAPAAVCIRDTRERQLVTK